MHVVLPSMPKHDAANPWHVPDHMHPADEQLVWSACSVHDPGTPWQLPHAVEQ
jgi:hypothetical protein